MARPSKSVDTMSKNLTKEEYETRKKEEEKLKGNIDKIKPPRYLTKNQKKIYKDIVKELKASEILCNLDIYLLENTAIAIDRIQVAENKLNDNIFDKNAFKIKESYVKELLRYMNELCLSPQSRAKLANINAKNQQENEDAVLNILQE